MLLRRSLWGGEKTCFQGQKAFSSSNKNSGKAPAENICVEFIFLFISWTFLRRKVVAVWVLGNC